MSNLDYPKRGKFSEKILKFKISFFYSELKEVK